MNAVLNHITMLAIPLTLNSIWWLFHSSFLIQEQHLFPLGLSF